jgi:low affinity Fe/Cu permease
MHEENQKSLLERVIGPVSGLVADVAGHPLAQIGFLVFCGAWFLVGWNVNLLTAGLSIVAITMTQMVLYRQNEREIDDHRRDVAMHAKLDELIAKSKQASNEFVGVEEKEEDEIVQLKEEVKEAVDEVAATSGPEVRETAKRVVEKAAEELKQEAGGKSDDAKPAKKRAGRGKG